MLNVYNNISPATGPHIGGICKIKICPREWLVDSLAIDFKTGRVLDEITLIDGKAFIDIDLLQETYDYGEKPKSTKQGTFYEISLSGNSNSLNDAELQTLQTYRYHQFVAILKDRQKRLKVVGDKDAGLLLQFANRETTDRGGTQLISIDMNMDLEDPAPFYGAPAVIEPPIIHRIFDHTFDHTFN